MKDKPHMLEAESSSREPVCLVATSTNTDVTKNYQLLLDKSCYLRIGLVVTGCVVVVGGSVVARNFFGLNL